ncbi:MAG: hypothetical protein C5B53_00385 [Candidatus Melainabacteria bacterium]|nr:MAG: hypothetical protein C5B53_00385 [Candidatus Melainabacteria bacterium]
MELSAYQRHRKRCLNGFRASFALFTNNGGSGALAVSNTQVAKVDTQPVLIGTQVRNLHPDKSTSLGWLANEICQEAGSNGGSYSDPAFSAHLALALKERNAANVVAIASSIRQPVKRTSSQHLLFEPWSSERQLQVLERGAYIRRNSLEQIIEVCSSKGEKIGFGYSPDGSLRIFTRFSSSAEVQALGVWEADQVIVKDSSGSVILVGESMEISETGSLTIHQSERHVYRIDLIHELYTEKQEVEGRDGQLYCLKAIFALDGFRMSTCFESRPENRYDLEQAQLLFRFYGRDGSFLEFDSEERLRTLEPLQSADQGTRTVKPNFIACLDGTTAWDSVKACAMTDWDYFHKFITEE